jgi:hypothetical protein
MLVNSYRETHLFSLLLLALQAEVEEAKSHQSLLLYLQNHIHHSHGLYQTVYLYLFPMMTMMRISGSYCLLSYLVDLTVLVLADLDVVYLEDLKLEE